MAAPQVLTLTDAAADRVKTLIARSSTPVEGLRVSIKSTGCSGYAYKVEYAEAAKGFEDVVEDKGVKIFVDPSALMFIIGATMDYREDKLQAGFVFENPNETSRCGCGESFSVDKKAMGLTAR